MVSADAAATRKTTRDGSIEQSGCPVILRSLGCGLTSDGAIAKSARLQLRSRITYLTSIVHIILLISFANTREGNSIFFRFRAFTMPNTMAFVDFGLLLDMLSEFRARLDAPLLGFALPGV